MREVNYYGQKYKVDYAGALLDPNQCDWNWVCYQRDIEGIPSLNKRYREVIGTLWEFVKKEKHIPSVKKMLSSVLMITEEEIWELFPLRGSLGLCIIAGLPKPND